MDPICVPAGPADAAVIPGMMREYYPIEGVTFRSPGAGAAGPARRAGASGVREAWILSDAP